MNELKKLTAEYFAIQGKCDGTSETFAMLHPRTVELKKKVTDLINNSRSNIVRYHARKLLEDVSDMEIRFWKHTWMVEE